MASRSISVFLVTANRLLREALPKVLTNRGGANVCGVSASLADSYSAISTSGAEILILDSIVPDPPDGSQRAEFPPRPRGIKIILINMDEDEKIFLDCVRAEVMGYLLKDASTEEVLSAIRTVFQGHAVFPPQICLPVLQNISLQEAALPSPTLTSNVGLTRRQQQLVPLIAQGLTNKEIASHLNLSEQTIKNHVHHMLRRVGASNRLQVVDATRRKQVAR